MTDPTQAIAPTTANLLRRLMALLYDVFLLFAITLGYGAFLLLIKILFNGTQDLETLQPGLVMQILSFIGWLAALAGYYFICWRKQGQTLGMKAWRIKLQQPDGNMATPKQCLIRTVLAAFLWQPQVLVISGACCPPPMAVCTICIAAQRSCRYPKKNNKEYQQ